MEFLGGMNKEHTEQRREPLTCVIGAWCADGCAIVSDTRISRAYEATNESKIHLPWDRAVLAGAGTTSLMDKLARAITKSKIPTTPDFDKVVATIENVVAALKTRYESRLGRLYSLQALMMGLEGFDKGDPYLRLIYQDGFSEDVKSFSIIGHGAPYVALLYRMLYDDMLRVEELAVLGYFCISALTLSDVDQTVGTEEWGPEAVILKTDQEPQILNPDAKEFRTARESLKTLKFKYKLVRAIWPVIPQAFETIDPTFF